MSPIALIDLTHNAGIRLGVDGSDLVLEAAAEPPEQLLALIQRFKPAIIEYLATADGSEDWSPQSWRALRAGTVEFDGGTTSSDPRARAYRCAVAQGLIRNPVPSQADCCLWCSGTDRQGALVVPIG